MSQMVTSIKDTRMTKIGFNSSQHDYYLTTTVKTHRGRFLSAVSQGDYKRERGL